MAEFSQQIKDDIIEKEKGYVNSVNDRGGETKYGISKRQYPTLDIKNLSKENALTIYQTDYWEKYNLPRINSQLIASVIFDMLVNMGSNAIRCAQRAVNHCEYAMVLKIDGVLGNLTIEEINSVTIKNETWLKDRIDLERIIFYTSLANRDPSQRTNLRGWINRVIL